MTRQSYFVKLLLGNLVLMGVIVFVGSFISNRYLTARVRHDQREQQIRIAELSHAFVRQLWPDLQGNPAAADDYCKRSLPAADNDARLTIIAADGAVLGDSSDVAAGDMKNHLTPDRPEIIAAAAGQDGWHVRTSETLGTEFRYYAKPVRVSDEVVAVVRVAMPTAVLSESAGFIWRSLLIGAGVAGAAAVLVAVWTSWSRYAPVRQIMRDAEALAAGNPPMTYHPHGGSELTQLAGALQQIRGSISRQADLIDNQRANLQAVLANLPEGVIATDREDRILLVNQAALRMLDNPAGPILDQHLQTVIRIVNIVDLCDEVRRDGRAVGRQVSVERDGARQTLDVRVSPIEDAEHYLGQLIVLQDITDRARVEAMKAEFVANTSHELRTPLATLRAAVDSLVDAEDWATAQRLTDVLDRHLTRLEDITADLLSLHSVEDPHRALRDQSIELSSLGEWIEHQYARHAEAKSIEMAVDVLPEAASVRCDPTLIEMILQNLIDNAVKFTPPEGQIRCRVGLADGHLTLEVADTGCGISPADQPRVFERFFQVDRAKTGDASVRGTGLGLSIVKHAAQRLDADVQLESEPDRGTTVTVRIPDTHYGNDTASESPSSGPMS